jgi:hypothetical protein
MTLGDGWQVWIRPPGSLKRSECGGAGTRRRVPAMPLSRRASGPWPQNRLRWVKPQYRMGRRRPKQARTLGFIPYEHERSQTWSRPDRSGRCRARQWFHPLSPATLRRAGDRRSKMGARPRVSREGGPRRKPQRSVIGSGSASQSGPETNHEQSNVCLNFDCRTARQSWFRLIRKPRRVEVYGWRRRWPVVARRSPVGASDRVASRRSAVPHTAPAVSALSNSQGGGVRLIREAGC